MTKHCTIEQSLVLKEIGFDMPVRDCYHIEEPSITISDGDYRDYNRWINPPHFTSAPTRSEVLDWAREKHGIDAWAMPTTIEGGTYFYVWQKDGRQEYSTQEYPTHPEAESALVDKIIEILKEKIITPSEYEQTKTRIKDIPQSTVNG